MPNPTNFQDNAAELLQILFACGPSNVVPITFASAITLPAPSAASIQTLTMTGASTITLPAPVAGGEFEVVIKQDATGSRVATWAATSGSVLWQGGSHTLTTTNWYGVLQKAFA
jgi:hypothetical protein